MTSQPLTQVTSRLVGKNNMTFSRSYQTFGGGTTYVQIRFSILSSSINCRTVYSSMLYETSYDHFKTLHEVLQFTICVVFLCFDVVKTFHISYRTHMYSPYYLLLILCSLDIVLSRYHTELSLKLHDMIFSLR